MNYHMSVSMSTFMNFKVIDNDLRFIKIEEYFSELGKWKSWCLVAVMEHNVPLHQPCLSRRLVRSRRSLIVSCRSGLSGQPAVRIAASGWPAGPGNF